MVYRVECIGDMQGEDKVYREFGDECGRYDA